MERKRRETITAGNAQHLRREALERFDRVNHLLNIKPVACDLHEQFSYRTLTEPDSVLDSAPQAMQQMRREAADAAAIRGALRGATRTEVEGVPPQRCGTVSNRL
jgi:hypothetical protein